MDDEELDNQLLDARLNAARQKATQSASFEPPKPEGRSPLARVGDELAGLGQGKSLYTRLPVVGPALDKISTGISAAVQAPFSDESWGDIYNRMNKVSDEDEARWAQRAPVATGIKNLAAGAALPPAFKGATLAGELGNIGVGAAEAGADTLLRTGRVSNAENAAEEAGILGGIAAAVPRVASGAFKGGARLLTGLKDDTLDYYRANRNAVNAADMDEIVRSGRTATQDVVDSQTQKRQDLAKYIEGLQQDVRGQARKGSAEAFDVLNQSDVTIPTRQLKSYPTLKMNQMKIGEAAPNTPSYRSLQNERQFLDDTGLSEMRPEDVKRYIMRLDQQLAPSFDKQAQGIPLEEGERALLDFRRFLDSRLKGDAKRPGVPGYAEAMKPVSDRMQALEGLGSNFTNADRAYNTLSRLDNPNMSGAREGLEGIGQFQPAPRNLVEEASGINQMTAPLKGMKPEGFEALANRMTRANPKLRDREVFDYVAQQVKGLSPEQAPVQDLQKAMKDISVQQAFEKPYVKGSRNVNLGGLSLHGLGSQIRDKGGDLGGIMGAAGAVIGAAADLIGPQTVKRVVDLLDSPQGQQYAGLYRQAMERGPQAIAITHEMLKRTDANYRQLTEGNP